MKKQKKQKLLNIWNKVKKPLIILSFVGNIIFLLFIIVGCVGVKKKSTQAKAEDTQERLVNLTGSTWYFNETITDTIQNVPWTESYDSPLASESYGLRFYINGNLYTGINTTVIGYSWSGVNYLYENSQGTTIRRNVYNPYRDIGWNIPGFSANEIVANRTIEIIEDNYNDTDLIDWFYENAELLVSPETLKFHFYNQINYNAPLRSSLESPFCLGSGQQYTIDLPIFYSNGAKFNQIKLFYVDGYAVRYMDSGGYMQINDSQGTCYFLQMEYRNTLTQESVVVNYRNFMTEYVSNHGSANETQSFITNGSYWINSNYQDLLFPNKDLITPQLSDLLGQFNSNYDLNGFSDSVSNVGLGNVFTLISSGFGAFINVMKIEVLPGLSLGLLCFLPLVLIVIMVIIKLVKR